MWVFTNWWRSRNTRKKAFKILSSLSMILKQFQPHDSYKKDSYKNMRVMPFVKKAKKSFSALFHHFFLSYPLTSHPFELQTPWWIGRWIENNLTDIFAYNGDQPIKTPTVTKTELETNTWLSDCMYLHYHKTYKKGTIHFPLPL